MRTAALGDREAILTVVRDAFSDSAAHGQEEVDIVAATWSLECSPEGLELVAVEGDALVGHVLGALGDLGDRHVVAVAPLAVTPSRQVEGIGSALMTELLVRAEGAGWPLVVLVGNPAYYRRFGFEPAGPLGIEYHGVDPGSGAFQVRRLAAYDPSWRGAFTYCWERAPN